MPYPLPGYGHSGSPDSFSNAMRGAIPVPVPGVSAYPPQFTWGLPHGPTAESRAPAAMAGALSAGQTAVGAVGAVAGMARMGEMLGWRPPAAVVWGSRLDPLAAGIDAGIAAYGQGGGGMAASALRAGVGGLAAGGVVTVGLAGLSMAVGHTITGFQQQAGLHSAMQGSFTNASAVSGRGYGAGDLFRTGSMLRQMDRSDPFTSMKDMQGATDSFHDMGMQQGLRDAEEGAKKLKGMVNTLRAMSRTLGTSLNEATGVLRGMRAAGIYEGADQVNAVRGMQVQEGLGVSNGAFLSAQAMGADMSRGMGMSGSSGAALARGSMRGLGLDVRAGKLSGESLMDWTGTDTLEGAQVAMGQRLSGKALGVLGGTSVGKALLAGLGEKKGGTYTGGVNKESLSRLLDGGGSLRDLSRMGLSNMGSSKASKASFVTNQENIMSGLAASGDGEDLVALVGKLALEESGGDTDMAKIYLEHMGIRDRRESGLIIDAARRRQERRREGARALRSSLAANEIRERQRLGLTRGGITSMVEGVTSPFEELGGRMSTQATEFVEHAKDNLYGISRFDLGDKDFERMSGDLMRGKVASPGSVGRDGEAYTGLAGRLLPAAEALVGSNRGLSGSEHIGRALHNPMGYSASIMLDSAQSMSRVSAHERAAMGQVARGEGVDWRAQGISADREAQIRGQMEGRSLFGMKTYEYFQRNGSFMDDVAGAIGDTVAAGGSALTLDASGYMRNAGNALGKAGRAMLRPFVAAAGAGMMAGAMSSPEDMLKLESSGGVGRSLLMGRLMAEKTEVGHYMNQKDAKDQFSKALLGMGIDGVSADRIAAGGPGASLLAKLARMEKEQGIDTMAEIGKMVDGIVDSTEYAKAQDKETYIATQLAGVLSKWTGDTVSPEAAKAVYTATRGGTSGGGTATKETWQEALKSGGRMQTTAFLNEKMAATASSLDKKNASALFALAGGEASQLASLSQGDYDSFIGASGKGGAMGSLLKKVAADPSAFGKLSSGGSTDQRLAAVLAQRSKALRATDNAGALAAFGVGKDDADYSSLIGMNKSDLVEQLYTDAGGMALSSGKTGGTTMLQGKTAVDRDIELATQIERINASTSALYNALVRAGTITGAEVVVASAQGDTPAPAASSWWPFS